MMVDIETLLKLANEIRRLLQRYEVARNIEDFSTQITELQSLLERAFDEHLIEQMGIAASKLSLLQKAQAVLAADDLDKIELEMLLQRISLYRANPAAYNEEYLRATAAGWVDFALGHWKALFGEEPPAVTHPIYYQLASPPPVSQIEAIPVGPDQNSQAAIIFAVAIVLAIVVFGRFFRAPVPAAGTGNMATTSSPQGEANSITPLSSPSPLPPTPSGPMVIAQTAVNVRQGPGTAYAIVAVLAEGQRQTIVGKTADEQWWQVQLDTRTHGWVYARTMQSTGDTSAIAVISDIPGPPSPTPAPVTATAPPATPIPPTSTPPPPTATALPPTSTPLPPTPTAAPPSPTPPSGFTIGALVRVQTAGATLRVRIRPGLDQGLVAAYTSGERLTIVGGPVEVDGITWWQVEGAAGNGWCAGQYLTLTAFSGQP